MNRKKYLCRIWCKVPPVLFTILFSLFTIPAGAQNGAQTDSLTIRDVFKAMPDSLVPYLTTNNRLDMMDFMDAKMKAVVKNVLEGESEMVFLSDDSLCVKMNEAVVLELKMEKTDTSMAVCMKKTYNTAGHQKEVITQRFTSSWCPVSLPSSSSTLLRRDEEVMEKPHF